MGRWRAGTVWLAMSATEGFFFHLMSTVYSVFLILQVGSDPLQLVLMGTILEVSYLLFEIPTGIVADAVSRKRSIVFGFVGTGIAFVMLGLADSYAVAALSQVLFGVSGTFVSGADVAWLTDEVGEEVARPLYVRSEQFYNGGALVGDRGERRARVGRVAAPDPDLRRGVRGPRGRARVPDDREPAPVPRGRHQAPALDAGHVGERRPAGASPSRPAPSPGDGRAARRLDRGLGPPVGPAAPAGDRSPAARRPGSCALVRDLRRGGTDAGHRCALLREAPGSSRGTRPRRTHPHPGRSDAHRERRGIRRDRQLLVGRLAVLVRGRASERPRADLHRVDQSGSGSGHAGDDQLDGGQADAVGQALAGPVVGGVGRAVSVPWAISLAGLLRLPILFLYLRAIRRGTVGTLPPEVMDQEIDLAEE